MKVICINADNKPKKIPNEQWVEKGKIYTVKRIVRLSLQKDKLGLILKEIQLIDCFPYEFYDSDRFTPIEYKEDKIEEKESSNLEIDLDFIS